MFNKVLYSRHLEQKNYLDHYLKFVLPCNDFHVVCFFQSENGGGYYEAWNMQTNTSIVRKSFISVESMSQPFEYREKEVAFFNQETMQLNVLHYLEAKCIVSDIRVPTPKLLNYLCEMEEDQKLNYFQHCLTYRYCQSLELLLLEEQFNTFSNSDGRCDDYYFSAWQIEDQNLAGEITINDKIQQLHFQELNQLVMIFKLYWNDEPLNFYIWNPRTNTYKQITVPENVNCSILSIFESQRFTIIKQENDQRINTEYLFIGNGNASLHPILMYVSFDMVAYDNVNYREQALELDKTGSLLIQVPWQMGQEYLVYYYTKSHSVNIAMIDIEQCQFTRLYSLKHETRIADFYFSSLGKQFIEVYEDSSKRYQQQEIQLPDQTEEVIQFHQHSFVPYTIYYFHYLFHTNMVHSFGEKIISKMMDMVYKPQLKQQKSEQQ